jgi:protein ImuA
MSPGGRAGAADLRRVIAEIEAKAGLAPASEAHSARRMAVARAFDPALGGGLAEDALHEIVPAAPADGPAAMGFALALAARFLDRRPAPALLIGEQFASLEAGALYGPGLVAHGLPLHRLVFVSVPDALSALWAMEEALKCGAPAVVAAEVWSLKSYGLLASRRLLMAARKGGTPALVVLAGAYGQADQLSTAAATRFEIAAAPSAKSPAAAGRDLPGPFACMARLVKARSVGAVDDRASALSERGYSASASVGAVDDRTAALSERGYSASASVGAIADRAAAVNDRGSRARLQAHDPTRAVRLEWRYEERCFDDPAISLALAAASGDRPRAASPRR